MKQPKVILEIEMTLEDYVAIKKDADWSGYSIDRYLVMYALGKISRGC